MHLFFRGVNDAFHDVVYRIHHHELSTYSTPSRAGDVIQVDEPMMFTYSHPWERVLFNRARDANPFFHLFEALWMLAGRNDVAPLLRYNSKIADVASDDGKIFNGAYGYRWRHQGYVKEVETGLGMVNEWKAVDQLNVIADQLRRKPESRRCVLQMWNVEDDLLKIDETKDTCCNTNAYFSIRTIQDVQDSGGVTPWGASIDIPVNHSVLDMTVCNRSNDLLWGMLGANFVHFSMLQEYMAAKIGVEVGRYTHVTNNLHVYKERWNPAALLEEYSRTMQSAPRLEYRRGQLTNGWRTGLGDIETFDKELNEFVSSPVPTRIWKNYFLNRVASPMCWAFELHKRREYLMALKAADTIEAVDWRIAAVEWIQRRKAAWEKKDASTSTD